MPAKLNHAGSAGRVRSPFQKEGAAVSGDTRCPQSVAPGLRHGGSEIEQFFLSCITIYYCHSRHALSSCQSLAGGVPESLCRFQISRGLPATEVSYKTLFNNGMQDKFNGGPAAMEFLNPGPLHSVEIIQGTAVLTRLFRLFCCAAVIGG